MWLQHGAQPQEMRPERGWGHHYEEPHMPGWGAGYWCQGSHARSGAEERHWTCVFQGEKDEAWVKAIWIITATLIIIVIVIITIIATAYIDLILCQAQLLVWYMINLTQNSQQPFQVGTIFNPIYNWGNRGTLGKVERRGLVWEFLRGKYHFLRMNFLLNMPRVT